MAIFLDNLYDIGSFKALQGSSKNFKDGAGILLGRSLEYIDPKVLEQKFPALSFLQSGITVNNSGGYAENITKRKRTVMGSDTVTGASDRGGNKEEITLALSKDTIKVFDGYRFSKWTETDLRQAEMENVNLVTSYIKGHNEIYNHIIDKAGFVGVEGNLGLLNYGFTSSASTGLLSTLTPQQMYDEFATLITSQWNGVFNTEGFKANVVVTSDIVINKLSATMLNTASGTSTVMRALQDNFGGVKFVATGKAYNGTSSVAVAFSNFEEAMSFRVPLKLQIGEIIKESSFAYKIDSMFRVAGLDVAEDTAGRKLTGL